MSLLNSECGYRAVYLYLYSLHTNEELNPKQNSHLRHTLNILIMKVQLVFSGAFTAISFKPQLGFTHLHPVFCQLPSLTRAREAKKAAQNRNCKQSP